jgi:hypothetical protein
VVPMISYVDHIYCICQKHIHLSVNNDIQMVDLVIEISSSAIPLLQIIKLIVIGKPKKRGRMQIIFYSFFVNWV